MMLDITCAADGEIGLKLFDSMKLAPDGHDPYAYMKDILTRLPTQRNSQIEELLPHRWTPQP